MISLFSVDLLDIIRGFITEFHGFFSLDNLHHSLSLTSLQKDTVINIPYHSYHLASVYASPLKETVHNTHLNGIRSKKKQIKLPLKLKIKTPLK